MSKFSGIRFSDARLAEIDVRLVQRLKPSRYLHSVGVCQTAGQLAELYGSDVDKAQIAGLLHDWDKALDFDQLRLIARQNNLASDFVCQQMPGVLHSFTAAITLPKEFPWLDAEVLQAIARHTCGTSDMTDLDKIVFTADLIEPNRTFDDAARLRELVGEVSLDELYYQAFKTSILALLTSDRSVYPQSIEVYNGLVANR